LRKLGIIGKDFSDKVGCDEVHEARQLIQKLVKHVGSKTKALEELPEMFGMIDAGETVDLRNLEDMYVQHKLFKICKLLHLPHLKTNALAFKKRTITNLHSFKLSKMIQHFIEKAECSEAESDASNYDYEKSDSDMSDEEEVPEPKPKEAV
jgi:hypothetical protein